MTKGQQVVSQWLSEFGMYVIALDNPEAFRQLARDIDKAIEKKDAEDQHD